MECTPERHRSARRIHARVYIHQSRPLQMPVYRGERFPKWLSGHDRDVILSLLELSIQDAVEETPTLFTTELAAITAANWETSSKAAGTMPAQKETLAGYTLQGIVTLEVWPRWGRLDHVRIGFEDILHTTGLSMTKVIDLESGHLFALCSFCVTQKC